jgi:hypothetical protein
MADFLVQLIVPINLGIVPVTIIFGTIGNSLNIFVLTRASLYRHSCSHYFLALTINNLIYCTVFLIVRLLNEGQQIIPLNNSLFLCKLNGYTLATCIFLSPYFIILASIDRYCASSPNAGRRNFSTIYIARWTIICTVVFFMLFFINSLVITDIQPDGYGCTVRNNSLYKHLFGIIEVILFAIVAPALMIFFGLMTIDNIKQIAVAPVRRTAHRRTEGQLARMLIFQVGIQFILTLPLAVAYLISVLPTTIQNTSIFAFVYSMSQIVFDFSYASTFILYILTAPVYKKELKLLFYKILRRNGNGQIHPYENNTTLVQQ